MKARKLPQEGKSIVNEVIENLQEIIWEQIATSVGRFVKGGIEKELEKSSAKCLALSAMSEAPSTRVIVTAITGGIF